MLDLPETDSNSSLVIRTHFDDDAAWEELKLEIIAPRPPGGLRAYVHFLDDEAFAGITADDLTSPDAKVKDHGFVFLADSQTFVDPERPIVVVDLWEDPGRVFRVVPAQMWSVQNNLNISNMDFSDFADSVSPDGVFRGFAEDM